ncbi:7-cyano-7-deazaguanine synthase QueC [Bdellovibrionota bacterium FG-2]
MSCVVLLSGGLDSAANLALSDSGCVLALTADYGQKAAQSEIRSANALCKHFGVKLQVLDLRWLGGLGVSSLTQSAAVVPQVAKLDLDNRAVTQKSADKVWVPNRNGVLINVAAAFAESLGASEVLVGFNREEAQTFPDNSAAFMESLNHSFEFSTRGTVRVSCHTVTLNKAEIVARLKREVPSFPFALLWSCYLGGERPCQQCESCQRLARALIS